eukprot:TRINITY_DN8574_c0_g1_i1.p1 TRINITY_DN8574_c0_g1~~TRINITY_DN8574_c0_g1_i1.p1  ORF type:complete len:513 (+),score=97.92 TRINITY_DN8574_c0_g1_i1:17-1555(+)
MSRHESEMNAQAIVVRKTFLEVGDQQSTESLRRQVSEPVNSTQRDDDTGGSFDAPPSSRGVGQLRADAPEYKAAPEMIAAVHASADNQTGLLDAGGRKEGSYGSKQRKNAGKGGGQQPANSEPREAPLRPHDGHLSRLKNQNITQLEPPWTDVTTVMMRNIPNKYTQQMLLQELRDAGFLPQEDFDFFYLPMDHSNCANLGYCFINFAETRRANDFAEALSGKRMRRFNSHKTAVIMPASIQGYDQNFTYYMSTRVVQASDPEFRPLFLRPMPDVEVLAATMAALPAGKARGKGHAKGDRDSAGGVEGKGARGSRTRRGGRDRDATGSFGAGSWASTDNSNQMHLPQMPAGQLQQDFQIMCMACGTLCGSNYRFCSFCGNFLGESSLVGGPLMMAAPYAQQEDLSTMTETRPRGSQMGTQHAPMHPLQARKQQANKATKPEATRAHAQPQLETNEAFANELDILHGRMMLLAALKAAGCNDQGDYCDTPMSSEDESAMGSKMWGVGSQPTEN